MSDPSVHSTTAPSLASALAQIVQPQQTASSTSVASDFAINPGAASTADLATSSASVANTPAQISSSTLSAMTQLQAASGLRASDANADTDSDAEDSSTGSSSLDPANSTALTQAQYAMQMSQLIQQDLTA